MSNATVPKEQQTAYQRWELSSLNGHDSLPASHKKENAKNADQLSSYLEGARKEAYAKGLQEGYAVGMAQARESAKADRQTLQSLTNAFSESLKQSDEVIAENLLALALDIAKAMLKSRLAVDGSLILPIVKDAIHYLPYVQRPAILIVNPDDAQVIRQYLMEDRKSTRLNSSHLKLSRMPSSA